MNRICTTIEQSQKLIELGIDINTADMVYVDCEYLAIRDGVLEEGDIPAWSLTALLNIMICPNLEEYIKGKWDLTTFTDESLKTPIEVQDCESAVDACYEMILKLKENNLI